MYNDIRIVNRVIGNFFFKKKLKSWLVVLKTRNISAH